MWSILLVITYMGVARQLVLPGYYDTLSECDDTIDRLKSLYDVSDEVEEATTQCVAGWHINFTRGDYNAY